MEERKLISPLVKQQADEIRYFGNDMAHGDFAQPVSADDAHEVLNILDVLIDAVYQQPAKLQAMQKREHRESNNKKQQKAKTSRRKATGRSESVN